MRVRIKFISTCWNSKSADYLKQISMSRILLVSGSWAKTGETTQERRWHFEFANKHGNPAGGLEGGMGTLTYWCGTMEYAISRFLKENNYPEYTLEIL